MNDPIEPGVPNAEGDGEEDEGAGFRQAVVDYIASQSHKRRYDRVALAVSILTLAAISGAGVVYYLQLLEMRGATTAATRSANAAAEAARAAAESVQAARAGADAAKASAGAAAGQVAIMKADLEASVRPALQLEIVERGDRIPAKDFRADLEKAGWGSRPTVREIEIRMKNHGPGVAYRVNAEIFLRHSQWCLDSEQHPGAPKDLSKSVTLDKRIAAAGDRILASFAVDDPLWQSKGKAVCLYGWFSFCDSLKTLHQEPFCWEYNDTREWIGPSGRRCDPPKSWLEEQRGKRSYSCE